MDGESVGKGTGPSNSPAPTKAQSHRNGLGADANSGGGGRQKPAGTNRRGKPEPQTCGPAPGSGGRADRDGRVRPPGTNARDEWPVMTPWDARACKARPTGSGGRQPRTHSGVRGGSLAAGRPIPSARSKAGGPGIRVLSRAGSQPAPETAWCPTTVKNGRAMVNAAADGRNEPGVAGCRGGL